MDHEEFCCLCALTKSPSDDTGWVNMADKWVCGTDTIDSIMKNYFPRGLLTQLPQELSQKLMCSTCFSSLKLIKDFIDKILEAQKKLKKLFLLPGKYGRSNGQAEKEEEISEDVVKPRRRGRPRKGASDVKSVPKEPPVIEEQQREKRTCRPPTRYGSDFYMTETEATSNMLSADAVTSPQHKEMSKEFAANSQATLCDQVSLPEIFMEVTVGETLDNQSVSCSKQHNESDDLKSTGNENNEVMIEDEAHSEDDSSDVTFKLSGFRRDSNSGKKRKRGRPKRRKRKEFKCDLCDKIYTAYASLVYHQLSFHEDKKDFNCNLCKKKFAHKALLTNHMFTHSSDRPFICDVDDCNANFKSRGSLFNHKRGVHNLNNGKILACELCGSQFAFKASLEAHRRIHLGEKPFSCRYCDKSFSHRWNMKQHVLTHTKEKRHVCDVAECGKSFTTSSQLKNHKMRHSTRKSFLCNKCPKSFSQHAGLITHMKFHEGESQECTICHKKFIDLSALRKHQRTHSGERPFRCDVCNKAFADQSNCRKHKKIHRKVDSIDEKISASPTDKNQNAEQISPPMNADLPVPTSPPMESIEIPQFFTEPNCLENEAQTLSIENGGTDAEPEPVVETLIQIVTPDELAVLNAGTSSENGSIIFLYHPNDLFSVSVEESLNADDVDTPADVGETVVIQELMDLNQSEIPSEPLLESQETN